MEQSLLDGRDLRSSDDDGIVSEYKRMHYSTMMGTDSSSDEESENNFIEEEEESSAESKRDDDIDQYCSQITSITHASEDEYAHLCAKVSKLARDKTWARSIQRFKEVAQLN